MKLYVTFGQVHVHSVGGRTLDKDCVAVIDCENYAEGRKKAFEYFGRKFHNTYDDLDQVGMEYYPRGLIHV